MPSTIGFIASAGKSVPVLDSLQVWIDFSNNNSLTLSGQQIQTATDLTGNNRNAGQYSSATRPDIATQVSGYLSRQSAYFNSKAMQIPYLISGGSARTVVMVAYVKTQSGFGHLLHSGTSTTGQSWGLTPFNLQYSPNATFGNHYWGYSNTSGVNVIGNSYMLGMMYDGTADRALINTNRYQIRTGISTGGSENYVLGSRIAGPFELATDSYIGEVCIYNRTITVDEQTSLYNYFKTKWGINT